jgi:5-methyltetrahydrofolate--homocysteine methyltransferase
MQAITGHDRSQMPADIQPKTTRRPTTNPGTVKTEPAVNRPRVVGGFARALTKISHAEVGRYAPRLDRDALFRKRWQMVGPKPARAAWLEAEHELEKLLASARQRKLWHGEMVYGLFAAKVEGRALLVLHPGTGEELTRLQFSPSLARRLSRRHGASRFHVALQVVTAGARVAEEARKLAAQGQVRDQFLLHGLSAELTEALAEYSQSQLPKLPGWNKTVRYSPGYPVWPDLSEQKKIFVLLRPERIGVTLTESFQMVPEYSTSAIVLPAP